MIINIEYISPIYHHTFLNRKKYTAKKSKFILKLYKTLMCD